jgi:hypothetical protein
MGGKFRVVAAGKNKLKLQAVIDGQREHGGPVNAGGSYLVGEKGPEIFVPRNSGGIIPNYALGGIVRSTKHNYGNRASRRGGEYAQVGNNGADTRAYLPPEIKTFKGNIWNPAVESIDNALTKVAVDINAALNGVPLKLIQGAQKANEGLITVAQKVDIGLKQMSSRIMVAAENPGKTLQKAYDKVRIGFLDQKVITPLDKAVQSMKTKISAGISSVGTSISNSVNAASEKLEASKAKLSRMGTIMQQAAISTGTPNARWSAMNPQRGFWATVAANKPRSLGQMDPGRGMMAGMGLTMAATGIGNAIGGSAGATTAGMAMGAGVAMQMGGLQAINSMLGKMKTFGAAQGGVFKTLRANILATGAAFKGLTVAEGLAAIGAKGFGLAMKTMMLNSPLVILLGIIAAFTAIKKFFSWLSAERAQNAKETTLTVGITAKAAEQAGIKYHDLSTSIKDTSAQLELMRAKGKAAFETFAGGGKVQGLTLSVNQLRKAIADAKKSQGELVGAFSNAGNGDASQAEKQKIVTDMAANLKAQFVSSGMSAEDATNKIFAMIKASKNADMAFNAITSSGFTKVTDAATATTAVIENLNKKMGEKTLHGSGENAYTTQDFGGKDLGNALSNSTAAIDEQMRKLIGTKDAMGNVIDAAKAYSMTMDDVNKKAGANVKLTDDQVASLKESHPELEKILNSTDSTASVFAKWQLELAGVQADLKNISGEEAQMLAQFEAGIQSAIKAQEATGKGILGRSNSLVTKLQKDVAAGGQAAAEAANKAQIDVQNEIKLIDKKIKAIQDEAQARRDAINVQKQQQDLADQIASKQLDILAAQATGNTQAEQQAKLDKNKLIREQQMAAATEAINAKEKAQVDALNKAKESQQAKADAAAKKLADAQAAAATASTRLSTVQGFQGTYESLVQQKANAKLMSPGAERDQALKDVEGALVSLVGSISASAKGKDAGLAKMLKETFGGTLIDAKTGAGLLATRTTTLDSKGPHTTMTAGLAEQTLNKSAVDATTSAVQKMAGGRSIADLERAIQGKGVLGGKTAASAIQVATESKYKMDSSKKGYLNDTGKAAVVSDNKLQPGQWFTYAGMDYRVDDNSNAVRMGKHKDLGTIDPETGLPKKATGGLIKGPGNGTSDSIYMPGAMGRAKNGAFVSNGEFVTTAASVRSIGADAMQLMNKFGATGLMAAALGKLKFNTGGNGFQMHDTRTGTNGTISIVQNIYPSPGMDMDAFAKKVVDMSVKVIEQDFKMANKMSGIKRTIR